MLDCHLILIKIKIISWTFGKKKEKKRTLEYQILKKFFWIAIENLTTLCLCSLTHVREGNHEDNHSQNYDLSLTWVVC